MKTEVWKHIGKWVLRALWALWLASYAWDQWQQARTNPNYLPDMLIHMVLPLAGFCLIGAVASWFWKKSPAAAVAIAIVATLFGAAVFVGKMISDLPPDTWSWDDLGLIAIIAYLPLMGLGWLVWPKRKAQKQP